MKPILPNDAITKAYDELISREIVQKDDEIINEIDSTYIECGCGHDISEPIKDHLHELYGSGKIKSVDDVCDVVDGLAKCCGRTQFCMP